MYFGLLVFIFPHHDCPPPVESTLATIFIFLDVCCKDVKIYLCTSPLLKEWIGVNKFQLCESCFLCFPARALASNCGAGFTYGFYLCYG